MRDRLVMILPIWISLRPELRNKLLRNCLAEKASGLLDKFCSRLLQIYNVSYKSIEAGGAVGGFLDAREIS
ncbi:hypothetical protein [Geobacter argillaceus]|uniref:hypothetical protein n=1 Tax=Geobacter argillaceus TaxID=345631 RepID=UPI0011A8A0C0|nr:hypothetical protein [Geobacter argillaceus]